MLMSQQNPLNMTKGIHPFSLASCQVFWPTLLKRNKPKMFHQKYNVFAWGERRMLKP